MNEPILKAIGTSGTWSKGMKSSNLGSGGQSLRSHKAKVGHRSPFWLDFDQIWQAHITVNAECVTTSRVQEVRNEGWVRPEIDLEA